MEVVTFMIGISREGLAVSVKKKNRRGKGKKTDVGVFSCPVIPTANIVNVHVRLIVRLRCIRKAIRMTLSKPRSL